jgi:hypothetical protein
MDEWLGPVELPCGSAGCQAGLVGLFYWLIGWLFG